MQTVKVFQFAVAPYILPLTSYILHLSLPSSLSNPKVIRASSKNFFTSPVVEKNFSRGGAIFIFIDDAKVRKIEMQNNSFPRLFFIKCNFIFCQILRVLQMSTRSDTATQLHSVISKIAVASKLFSISYIIYIIIIIII